MTNIANVAIGAGVSLIVSATLTFIGRRVGKVIKELDGVSKSMTALVASNEAQTKNITMLCTTTRFMIKATKAHSYALRELGANGSVTDALKHVGDAEKAIDDRSVADAAAAMTARVEG